MITNKEALEYLNEYPRSDVESALTHLGRSIDDQEFPESIVEDVQSILDSIGEAIVKQKQLQATQAPEKTEEPESEAIVVQETAAIAAELLDVRNVQIDPKSLFAVAQSVIIQTKSQAAAINQLRRETLVAELRRGQQELTDDLLQVMQTGQKSTDDLFQQENLQKMVEKAVPAYTPKFNVDNFIAEVKLQATEITSEGNERVRVGTESRSTQIDFDLDGFLGEIWE